MSHSLVLAWAALVVAGAPLRPSELAERHPVSGTFEVVGYVIKAYHCPPCPKGAVCKPCMPDNVVLADVPRRIETYTELQPGDLIIQTGAEQLEVGRRYRVSVEVLPESTTGRGHDLRLRSVEPSR